MKKQVENFFMYLYTSVLKENLIKVDMITGYPSIHNIGERKSVFSQGNLFFKEQ